MMKLSAIISVKMPRCSGKGLLALASLCLMAGLCIFAVSSAAIAAKGDLANVKAVSKHGAPFPITLGKAELVDVSGNVSDVLVADPSLIDVVAIQANRLYIVGLQVGDTNIIALDDEGNIVKRLDVHVSYDLQAIQSLVNELFPKETVQVRSVHDQILLTGNVSSPEVASRVANVVGHYVSDLQDEEGTADELVSNLMDVRGEQQVLLQVRIIEASRSVSRELGVNTNLNDPNELSAVTLFGNTPPSNLVSGSNALSLAGGPALSPAAPPAAFANLLFDSGLNGIGDVGIFVNALEEEGLVNTLAEPNLTAVSGQQAGFLAGGEFPVPSGLDNVGNVTIDFREFGVSLNFLPVVLSEDRISLQLNTEVSALDFDNAVSLAGVVVPGLSTRRADTTVEIPSGASLMIAGLLQSDAVKSLSALPGISKAPVLGDLVKSNSFSRDETELIVIVTPYLVEPYKEKERAVQAPPKKTRNPLAQSFAANMRRSFKTDKAMFAAGAPFGYILD